MSSLSAQLSRRRFVFSGAALVAGSRIAAASSLDARQTLPQQGRIYIGTNETGAGKGILTATWNSATGEIGTPELAAELPNPAFLVLSRHGSSQFLYAVSEVDSPHAMVSAFAVESGPHRLRMLNQLETQGSGPTHLSVSPDGRTVAVANYGGGSVTSFRVAADGSLEKAVFHEQYHGSGPYKGRQDAPHTHSAAITPDGRSVLVNDLGLDRIFIYELDPATSVMKPAATPYWSAKPGSGPRHIAFNPKGDRVYSTNELTSTVDVLHWDAARRTLTREHSVSTLPPDFPKDKAFVGEIVASGDGRNVYAGNRVADDTIAVFDVKGPGEPRAVQFAPTGGVNCRHITLDPTGRWMVVSHQKSGDLTVLGRDWRTGWLSAPLHAVPVTHPMCVVFA